MDRVATAISIVVGLSAITTFIGRFSWRRIVKPWLQGELHSIREPAQRAASEATAINAAVNHVGPSDQNLITLAQNTFIHVQQQDAALAELAERVAKGFESLDARMNNQDSILTGHLAWHSKEEIGR